LEVGESLQEDGEDSIEFEKRRVMEKEKAGVESDGLRVLDLSKVY